MKFSSWSSLDIFKGEIDWIGWFYASNLVGLFNAEVFLFLQAITLFQLIIPVQ